MVRENSTLDDAIDELYAVDLDEFVPHRDQLARELRGNGDRDAAADVKQLKKPSRVAWAVNQAARHEPKLLDAVLRAGSALRDAQQHALREGASSALHDAVRARQRAVRALANVAIDALGPTGATARDAIEQTLNAASIDDDAAATVRAARLTTELEPPDVFAALAPGPGRPVARPKSTKATKAEKPAATTSVARESAPPPRPAKPSERARQATAAAKEARRDAELAERERARAAANVEALAQRARDAAERAEEARRAARDATEHARDARRRAERAEEAARRATGR